MVWAQNSSSNQHGNIESDQGTYFLESGKTVLVKISGHGTNFTHNVKEKVFLIITLPDSSTQNHQIFSTGAGDFEVHYPLTTNSQIGTYEVFSSFKNSILDTIYFQVKNPPSGYTGSSSIQQHTSPSITATTNSEIYEKGDSIRVFGTVDKVGVVTAQVLDPKYNLVQVAQVKSSSDGTYSIILNTNSPLWKGEGDYTVMLKSGEWDAETIFYLSDSKVAVSNPITQSEISDSTGKNCIKSAGYCSTYLDLNWRLEDSMKVPSTSLVHLYGTLNYKISMVSQGTYAGTKNTPLVDKRIDIINADSGSLITTLQTKNDGTFSTFQKVTPGSSYKIQAVYEGSNVYEPSKTAQYGVDVPSIQNPIPTTPTSPIQNPSTQSTGIDESAIIGIILVVLVSAIIGIIVVITKNKKKQKVPQYVKVPPKAPRKSQQRTPSTIPNPPGNTESSTMFFYECPKCHGSDIQNNPDGSVNCPDCGFRG